MNFESFGSHKVDFYILGEKSILQGKQSFPLRLKI